MASDKICSVEGCGKPMRRNGMCQAHSLRVRRHGSPERDPKWVQNNHCGQSCPAAKRLAAHLDYAQHFLIVWVRAAKRYVEKRDAICEYLSRDYVQAKARSRTVQWAKDNPERRRVGGEKFKRENVALVRSYKAKRRAAQRQAVPPWLTEEMESAIRALYAEAERLTQETGIEHEVDHIVPLQGKTVCGLHVPWNLRVLTRIANNGRPRIWTEQELPAVL